jgi:tetratricopeptide (TPR) repeat protein
MVAPPAIVAEPVVAPPMPAEPQQEMARQSANEARLASAAAPAQPMRTDAMTSAEAEGRMAPAKPGYGSASRDGVEFADTAPPPRPAAVLAPPPPPPAMVVASKSAAFAPSDIPVTAQRAAKAKDAGDLVVTGQHRAERLENLPASIAAGKRRKSTLSGAGDWNACTINDPGRNLRSCRRLLDPAAPGPKGQAAARVADGLSRAWQGDLDGAIAAFDKAIATAPNDAIAYLNRGLALQRKGEFSRANADLDRAVRYAPGAARGYFNRGQLLRQRGEADRATADEDRAVALDPGYEAVVQ